MSSCKEPGMRAVLGSNAHSRQQGSCRMQVAAGCPSVQLLAPTCEPTYVYNVHLHHPANAPICSSS